MLEYQSYYRRQRDGVFVARSPVSPGRQNLQSVSAAAPWLRRFFVRSLVSHKTCH